MSPVPASLLVDVSNSRTKFALYTPEGFSPVRVMPTPGLSAGAVRRLLQGWSFARAVVSSVVPGAASCLQEVLECPVCWLDYRSRLNLQIGYEHAETLGADRLACAVALAQEGMLPAIAVDAGTAVTFDLVLPGSPSPVYAGGAICPGLRTMMHALSSRAALLPEVALPASVPAVGHSTSACLQSGLLNGFAGMVDGVLSAISAELGVQPRIVFTGGDAEFLSEKSRFPHSVDKMLVFNGLAIAGRLNP